MRLFAAVAITMAITMPGYSRFNLCDGGNVDHFSLDYDPEGHPPSNNNFVAHDDTHDHALGSLNPNVFVTDYHVVQAPGSPFEAHLIGGGSQAFSYDQMGHITSPAGERSPNHKHGPKCRPKWPNTVWDIRYPQGHYHYYFKNGKTYSFNHWAVYDKFGKVSDGRLPPCHRPDLLPER